MNKKAAVSTQKIISRTEAARIAEQARAQGLQVGYTSGVFDLLHPGHVEYLEAAKALCDLLIVGLNSDSSVQQNKGPLRPVISEQARARVLAGLSPVDHLFIFDERNNNLNIELLKPTLYIKAADYSNKPLTSAPIVEKHGGRVQLVELEAGHSSSAIIEKILSSYTDHTVVGEPRAQISPAPAVFVDRDGTLNEHSAYLKDPAKFKIIPDTLEALLELQQQGLRVVVVTNQPGIGLGYFTYEDFCRVNSELLKASKKIGLTIDRVYFSPHASSSDSPWRKPNPGMILQAAKDLNILLEQSTMIGDTWMDVQAGAAAGVATVLVHNPLDTGHNSTPCQPDLAVNKLREALPFILRRAAGESRSES